MTHMFPNDFVIFEMKTFANTVQFTYSLMKKIWIRHRHKKHQCLSTKCTLHWMCQIQLSKDLNLQIPKPIPAQKMQKKKSATNSQIWMVQHHWKLWSVRRALAPELWNHTSSTVNLYDVGDLGTLVHGLCDLYRGMLGSAGNYMPDCSSIVRIRLLLWFLACLLLFL